MLKRWGFTVVELVVVMVIMAILLAVAGLTIGSSQARARDTERASDIDNLARGLEVRYSQGNGNGSVTFPSYVTTGSYPGTKEMQHIIGQSVAGFTPAQVSDGYGAAALIGTSVDSFSPPTVTGTPYGGFIVASSTCAIEDTTCIDGLVSSDSYYYEPINADGTVCQDGGCVRYNLYWQRETGDITLQKLRSKHQ